MWFRLKFGLARALGIAWQLELWENARFICARGLVHAGHVMPALPSIGHNGVFRTRRGFNTKCGLYEGLDMLTYTKKPVTCVWCTARG